MLAYIYNKNNNTIIQKITNVKSLENNNKIITGNSKIILGILHDFIVLDDDKDINKNIGDIIDLTGLTDVRDSVNLNEVERLKGKFTEAQINLKNTQKKLEDSISDNTNTMMAITELYEMIPVTS